MIRHFVITAHLVACLAATAATSWYVDSAASGSNNGTSWTDAWEEMDQIAWGSVAAGDTVYICGGTTSKVYTTALSVTNGAAGTSASPITIRLSPDEGHNGLIVLSNVIRTMQVANTNIIFNFARDPDYIASLGYSDDRLPVSQLWMITNNIGCVVRQTNCAAVPTGPSGGGKVLVAFRHNLGNKLLWCEVGPGGHELDMVYEGYIRTNGITAVQWGADSGTDPAYLMHDAEMAFNYVHDVNQDGVNATTTCNATLGGLRIHHNIIMGIGDDCYEGAGSVDICYNIIGKWREGIVYQTGDEWHSEFELGEYWGRKWGHPDTIACPGLNFRIYNNIVYDVNHENHDAAGQDNIRLVPLLQWTGEVGYNGFVYGNVVLNAWSTNSVLWTANPRIERTNEGVGHFEYTNIVWMNNTVARSTFSSPGLLWGRLILGSGLYEYLSESTYTTLSNAYALNNVIWDVNRLGSTNNTAAISAMTPMTIDYNTLAPPTIPTLAIATNEPHPTSVDDPYTIYSVPAYNTAYGAASNTTATVSFVSTNDGTWDFHLASTDTGAKDVGLHPTNALPAFLLTLMPDYDVDMDYNPRALDGAWDRGAYEQVDLSSGLLSHLSFEDDWETTGYVTDQSGNLRHMLCYGYTNFAPFSWPWASPPVSNWPARVAGPVGSYAGQFVSYDWNTNIFPPPYENYHDGEYGAITNLGPLTNLSTMTVALWARYDATEVLYQNGAFLDGGYGIKGAWTFGRYGSTVVEFNLVTNVGVYYWTLPFPADTGGHPDYVTTNWTHYAVTVDCSDTNSLVFKGYHNGQHFLTTNYTGGGVTAMNLNYTPVGSYGPWLAVGCRSHIANSFIDATPPIFDDNHPNHGWFTGKMDDVRIYDRVLSADEIAALFALGDLRPGTASAVTANVGSIVAP